MLFRRRIVILRGKSSSPGHETGIAEGSRVGIKTERAGHAPTASQVERDPRCSPDHGSGDCELRKKKRPKRGKQRALKAQWQYFFG